jgi:long-subunit fatty acid transport protein
LSLQPEKVFRVALSYRGKAELESDLRGDLAGDVDATLLQIPLRYDLSSLTVTGFVPRQLSAGIHYQPSWGSFYLDAVWEQWSSYKSPISTTRANVEAEPPPGLGIRLPEPTPLSLSPAPSFNDTLSLRVGVEWLAVKEQGVAVPVRFGYRYEQSPVPPQTQGTRFLDSDKHVLAAGVGSTFGGGTLWLDGTQALNVAASWGLLKRRNARAGALALEPLLLSGNYYSLSMDVALSFH